MRYEGCTVYLFRVQLRQTYISMVRNVTIAERLEMRGTEKFQHIKGIHTNNLDIVYLEKDPFESVWQSVFTSRKSFVYLPTLFFICAQYRKNISVLKLFCEPSSV